MIIIFLFPVSFYIKGYIQEKGRQKAIPTENKERPLSNNKSTIIQESKESQSPPIIAGGDVNINYDSLPKTRDKNDEILKAFEQIKKRTIIGVEFQTYVELLYDTYMELQTFLKDTKANKVFVSSISKTYNCYNDALAIWEKGSPDALMQDGIVSLYSHAVRRFNNETVPILIKKWLECANYLEEAKQVNSLVN